MCVCDCVCYNCIGNLPTRQHCVQSVCNTPCKLLVNHKPQIWRSLTKKKSQSEMFNVSIRIYCQMLGLRDISTKSRSGRPGRSKVPERETGVWSCGLLGEDERAEGTRNEDMMYSPDTGGEHVTGGEWPSNAENKTGGKSAAGGRRYHLVPLCAHVCCYGARRQSQREGGNARRCYILDVSISLNDSEFICLGW